MAVPHQKTVLRKNQQMESRFEEKQGKIEMIKSSLFDNNDNSQIQFSEEVEHVGRIIGKWEEEDSQDGHKNSRESSISSFILINTSETIKIKPNKNTHHRKVKHKVLPDSTPAKQENIIIEKIGKRRTNNNQRKPNKLKMKSDSHSTPLPGNEEHKIKKQKSNVKPKLSDGVSLESESQNYRQIQYILPSKRLKNYNPQQTIIDSRKQARSIEVSVQTKSFFMKLKEKFIPVQRLLTFSLMVQILGQFALVASLTTQNYWILATIALVLIPTYFAWKCASKTTSTGHLLKQQNEEYSEYEGQGKRQQNIWEASEISGLKLSKMHNIVHCNEQENTIGFRNSRTEFQENTQQKYLIVVPYLHNNQLHPFSKCVQCRTTCINSRIKHCQQCHGCHLGYDHYCKFLAVCVDSSNYHYFLRFVITVEIFGLLLIAGQIFFLFCLTDLTSIAATVLMIILLAETILCMLFCTYIVGYHLWLTNKGVSTRQNFMGNMQNPGNSTLLKSISHGIGPNYLENFLQQIPFNVNNGESLVQIYEDFDFDSNNTMIQSKSFQKQTLCQDEEERTQEGRLGNSKVMTIHKIVEEPEGNDDPDENQSKTSCSHQEMPTSINCDNSFRASNESTFKLKRTSSDSQQRQVNNLTDSINF